MEGCCTTVDLDPAVVIVLTEPAGVVAGFSSARMRGINSDFILSRRGLTTLPTTESSPSLIDFSPSPRASESIPKFNSSNVSNNSPAKSPMANACSWVGFGAGACGVGAGEARNAGVEMRSIRCADRLVIITESGRCRQRSNARCK